MLTKTKMTLGTTAFLILALIVGTSVGDGGLVPSTDTAKPERRLLELTVTREKLRITSAVLSTISYRSSSSDWRGPFEHKSFDPWHKKVSVKVGDIVFLEANQATYNGLSCVITNLDTGERSKIGTRKSIGAVKCHLLVK